MDQEDLSLGNAIRSGIPTSARDNASRRKYAGLALHRCHCGVVARTKLASIPVPNTECRYVVRWLRSEMRPGDLILDHAAKGVGASLTIRYFLPGPRGH
jgi:hypothetical protein